MVSAGLVNAILLAVAAIAATFRDRRWSWLAGFLLIAATTLVSIVVQHRTDGRTESIAVAAEQLSWATGPLLYCFVRSVTGWPVGIQSALRHLALPLAVLATETPIILLDELEPLPAWMLVAFQMGYTLACGWTLLARPQPAVRSALTYWAPLGAVAAVTSVHAAQMLRWTAWGRLNPDAVPTVASFGILIALLGLLTLSGPIARSKARYSRSGLKADDGRALFNAARTALLRERMFARVDLSLADVATALGVKTHRLSQAISEGGATSFSELLIGLRVEEARCLLAEARNATVALEPVGMEAGFRSRSAFYAAFKRRTGMTPGEYRQNVSRPSGQDTPRQDARASVA
ncbi:MAG: AraC family transcriptional regulator [Sphingomicrobium sp.]